jgi:hypothetical protein
LLLHRISHDEWSLMAQDYDVSVKLLFHHSRGLVAQKLFGGPVVEWVNVEQAVLLWEGIRCAWPRFGKRRPCGTNS